MPGWVSGGGLAIDKDLDPFVLFGSEGEGIAQFGRFGDGIGIGPGRVLDELVANCKVPIAPRAAVAAWAPQLRWATLSGQRRKRQRYSDGSGELPRALPIRIWLGLHCPSPYRGRT